MTAEQISAGIAALDGSPKLQQALTGLLKAANGDVKKFLDATEAWFDAKMERVTGSYKRWAKRWVIVIAVVVVGVGGIDSIAIARALYADEAIRTTVVQQVTDEEFCDKTSTELTCARAGPEFPGEERLAARLVEAQPGGRQMGLAAEDSRAADHRSAPRRSVRRSGTSCWTGSGRCEIPARARRRRKPDRSARFRR